MSTFLIETSEEDTTTAVAKLVAEYLDSGKAGTGSAFVQTCSGLVAGDRNAELLELFLGHLPLIFSKATGKDLECILLVICNLVPKLPAEHQKAAVLSATTAFIKSAEQDKNACLMALVELYNIAFDTSARFAVLLEIIKFARVSGLQDEVGPVVKGKTGDWVKEWGLSKADARALYLEVSALLKSLKTKAAEQESYELRIKCLASFEDSDAAELAEVRSVAAETAADFVQNPMMYKCDLFSIAAFKQLESDREHVAVFKLLSIMLAGDVKALQAFGTEHPSALAACNVSLEDATTKTRLMALLSLGSQTAARSATVTFDQIRNALSIGDEEVEGYVVMAIGKKLVDARINQPERSVTITRCTLRTFEQQQWVQLRDQIAGWTTNLAAVAEMVASAAVQG